MARGSNRPPRLVILRYRGAAADAPTLAIVGKGVTFDSGGLSLKPTDCMLTMKCDMAGAATMLAAMQAIAQLKLPVQRDRPGRPGREHDRPGAYKLGDVLHARSGKTIEVHNTDAEGPAGAGRRAERGGRNRRGEDHRSGHAHRRVRRGAWATTWPA